MKKILCLLIVCLFDTTALADFITVGSGEAEMCDESNMDDALARGTDEIRFTNQGTFSINQTISRSVTIYGGYASCQDASQGIYDLDQNRVVRSRLSKNKNFNVVSIDGGEENIDVRLLNIIFSDGENINGIDGVGGIDIKGENTLVRIYDSSVVNNAGDTGGGIKVEGSSLTLFRTNVSSNTASMSGGGVYCQGQNTNVTITSEAAISYNSSVNGGGLYITAGCRLWNYGSTRQKPVIVEGGIFGNFASEKVGGVFVNNGSSFRADSSVRGLSLFDNRAHTGGGAYASGMSRVLLGKAIIDGNVASFSVGGVRIGEGSSLTALESSAVTFQNNHAPYTGAIGIFGENSIAELVNLRIINNSANQNAVLAVGLGAMVTMDSEGDECYLNGTCMTIEGNITAVGEMVFIRGGSLAMNNTVISNNTNEAGAGLVGMFEFISSDVQIKNSLIVDNDSGNNLFVIKDGLNLSPSAVEITHTTIANNTSHVIMHNDAVQFDSFANVMNSVILSSGAPLSSTDDDGFSNFLCNLSDYEINNIDDENTNSEHNLPSQGNDFIGGSNYRLRENSWAIDMCEGIDGFSIDLENKLRGNDYPPIPNFRGSYDAGAYEFDPHDQSDIIFKDGYELNVFNNIFLH